MHICTVNRANQTFMVMSQYGENGLVSTITEALYIEYRICEQIPKLWRLESIVEVDHQFAFDLKDDLVIQR